MKNVFLFTILLSFNCVSAQWTQQTTNDLSTDNSVTIGDITNGDWHYGLYHSSFIPSRDYLYFVLKNSSNQSFFEVGYDEDTPMYLGLRNYSGSELFKVSKLGVNIDTVFLHLPTADSRIVIGGFGNYLLNEGHKFIVRNGNAKIEGNLYANENIGIGTMSFSDGSDTYRLSVNGKVRANSVKVYNTWADYVFDTNYNLPTLYEVERFIKKNGHLKDIPSAEEVEENGIDLGEMNKLLLQKIEELTLYTIELKKNSDELKKESDLLKKEVKTLKEKIQD